MGGVSSKWVSETAVGWLSKWVSRGRKPAS